MKTTLVENYRMDQPIGQVDINVESKDGLENMAIVPAWNQDTGEIVCWSLVPLNDVAKA